MSLLNLFKPGPVLERSPEPVPPQPIGESLEDVLLELAKWGRPRVGQYGNDGTWHCGVDVNVTPVGVKFEAKSDFNQTTPIAAALQCRANLLAAVKAIGGAA
jgi:hypothetical protein